MRTIEMIKAKVETETEALGFVLAAMLQAQPSTPQELAFFLEKIQAEVIGREQSGAVDSAAFYAAASLLRGVRAFEHQER